MTDLFTLEGRLALVTAHPAASDARWHGHWRARERGSSCTAGTPRSSRTPATR